MLTNCEQVTASDKSQDSDEDSDDDAEQQPLTVPRRGRGGGSKGDFQPLANHSSSDEGDSGEHLVKVTCDKASARQRARGQARSARKQNKAKGSGVKAGDERDVAPCSEAKPALASDEPGGKKRKGDRLPSGK